MIDRYELRAAIGTIVVSIVLGLLLVALASLSGCSWPAADGGKPCNGWLVLTEPQRCGTKFMRDSWAKVPSGAWEKCERDAAHAAIEYLGPQLVRGVGLLDCDGKGHCTCHVFFEPLYPRSLH